MSGACGTRSWSSRSPPNRSPSDCRSTRKRSSAFDPDLTRSGAYASARPPRFPLSDGLFVLWLTLRDLFVRQRDIEDLVVHPSHVTVDDHLGGPDRIRRLTREQPGHREGLCAQVLEWHRSVDHSERGGFGARHETTGEHKFLGLLRSDEQGQGHGGTAAGYEAEVHMGVAELGAGGRNREVA